tara:strand:+ start:740 stop:1531 length:792 start_codon:yes stop_codon:yes gene_type:complete
MELRPKKSLGQNFLLDKNIIKSIVKIGNIDKNSKVLEIGPGKGNLTEFILKEKPKKLIVIEKDNNLTNLLYDKFSNQITLLNQDILSYKFNFSSKDKLIVFGNLPYNISTKILTNWITDNKKYKSSKKLIFMFQKEVADRIIAKTNSKNYGRLSIIANWRFEIKKEMNISSSCFFPKPKVDSSLISFTPKKIYFNIKDPKNLEKISDIFFNQRRKMIKKPLNKIFNKTDNIIKKLELNLNLRPQNLSPETYFKITREYENLIN